MKRSRFGGNLVVKLLKLGEQGYKGIFKVEDADDSETALYLAAQHYIEVASVSDCEHIVRLKNNRRVIVIDQILKELKKGGWEIRRVDESNSI